MLRQRFLALLTLLLALCATPRLACACSVMPVCSGTETGAHILAIAASAVNCCGEELCDADEHEAAQADLSLALEDLSLAQEDLSLAQEESSLALEPLFSTHTTSLSHENSQGSHSSMQNEHRTCHMTSPVTPGAVHGRGLSIEESSSMKPATQAAAPFYLQKKCTALVGIFNKAPPYLNAFGGSQTYLFKRVLLI